MYVDTWLIVLGGLMLILAGVLLGVVFKNWVHRTLFRDETFMSSYSPKWRRASYGSYSNSELRALRFCSTQEFDRAIDFIWSDPDLKSVPNDTPDGITLIVPTASVEVFQTKGLKFDVELLA